MSAGEPHVIRLRGPWEYVLLDGPQADSTGTFTMTGDWPAALPPHRGGVRLVRWFQAPSGLTGATSVHLVVHGFTRPCVSLDGASLPLVDNRCELLPLLKRRHRLEIEVDFATELSSQVQVVLEIHER